jgi:hypothetical protein
MPTSTATAKASKEPKAPERKAYILVGDEHNGIDEDGDRRTYVKGESVLLTANQYRAFRDKFRTAEQQKAELEVARIVAEKNEELANARAELGDLASSGQQLKGSDRVETAKKPDPFPPVGTPEPAPPGVTPAPIGSTPDPVNAPPDPNKPATGKTAETQTPTPTPDSKDKK